MEVFEVMAKKGIGRVNFIHDFEKGKVIVEPKEIKKLAPEQCQLISKLVAKRGEGHEKLTFGLLLNQKVRILRAIHDSLLSFRSIPSLGNRGYPLGGLRWKGNYANEIEAVIDNLDLAEGMSGKGYWAGTGTSGSKVVSWTDLALKTPEALEAFGEFQEKLADNITGEDMNITSDDCSIIARKTRFIGGLKVAPGYFTGQGVFLGWKSALGYLRGTTSFKGITVAIQGITSSVAEGFIEDLIKEGAIIIGSYWEDEKKARELEKRFGIKIVPGGKNNPLGIFKEKYEILSLNGTGKWLNEVTVPLIPPGTIIGGGANNQLADPRDYWGDKLFENDVWYLPDYVMNAGGVINVVDEFEPDGYNKQRVLTKKIPIIAINIPWILSRAKIQKVSSHRIADMLPRAAIKEARQRKYGMK